MLIHRALQALASARQVSEMRLRIATLENENARLRAGQDGERFLKISDIMGEINNYQTSVQMQMFNLLRTLVVRQDNNWIEKIRAAEERTTIAAVSVCESSGK